MADGYSLALVQIVILLLVVVLNNSNEKIVCALCIVNLNSKTTVTDFSDCNHNEDHVISETPNNEP